MGKRLLWLLDNLEEVLAGSFLISMIALMFSQVIYRYFFGKAIAPAEELARYAFMFAVYLATSLTAKQGRHVRVTAQLKIFPYSWRKYFIMFADLIWLFFNGVVVYQGFKLFASMDRFPLISAVMGWNLKYIFAIVPVCFLLQSFRIIQHYVVLARSGQLDNLAAEGEEI